MTKEEFEAKWGELREQYPDVHPEMWLAPYIPNDMLHERVLLGTAPPEVLEFCRKWDDLNEEYYGDLLDRKFYNCVPKGKKKEWMRRLKEKWDEMEEYMRKHNFHRE